MMKHAYLIIANSSYQQLKVLINLLDDNRNDIYLMIDKKSKLNDCPQIKTKKSNIYYLPSIPIFWGEYSGIQAEMMLFKAAFKKKYKYYHLLSGQDLPITSQNNIHNFFDNCHDKIFVSYQTSTIDEVKDKIKPHLFRKYYNDGVRNKKSNVNCIFRIFISIYRHVESMVLKILFNDNDFENIKTGPNWVSIDNSTVALLIDSEKEIFNLFHKGKVIDEMFVQTIVSMNKEQLNKVSDPTEYHSSPNTYLGNLRYVVKNSDDAHPKTFTFNDFNEILKAKDEGYLFARKFDIEKDKSIINEIVENISEEGGEYTNEKK